MKRILLLTLLFVITIGSTAEAQRRTKTSKKRKSKVKTAIVTTEDGSQLRGEIRKLTEDSLVIETEQFGELRYLRDEVEYVIDSRGDKAIRTNGNKYLISPSALPVEESYIEFTGLAPTAGFRINDYLSASFTIEPFTSIAFRYPNVAASIKGTRRLGNRWHGALGVNVGTIGSNGDGAVGILSPFITFTNGDVNNHLSGTVRFLTAFSDGESASIVNLSLAGTKRMTRRLSLMGEMHLFAGGDFDGEFAQSLIIGLRRHPGSGATTYNYGIITLFPGGIPLPYFGLSFPIH